MKKRYAFTLTQEKVELLQAQIKELGLPPATISAMVDDILPQLSDMIELILSKKRAGQQLTFNEMLSDAFGRLSQLTKEG